MPAGTQGHPASPASGYGVLAPLIAVWIALGLTLDARLEYGQTIVDIVTWLFFAVLWFRGTPWRRRMMIACLVYAAVGEVFLALVWKIYEYRDFNLPLFVPPGHVLLFLCGTEIAPRLSRRVLHTLAFVSVSVVLSVSLVQGDLLSLPLLGVFVLALLVREQRPLFVTMFVLALLMELYGTWLGNWRWHADVPWLGIATSNPPLAVGAIYVVLDRLVYWTAPVRPAQTQPQM